MTTKGQAAACVDAADELLTAGARPCPAFWRTCLRASARQGVRFEQKGTQPRPAPRSRPPPPPELMFNGVFSELDAHQLAALASCLVPVEKTKDEIDIVKQMAKPIAALQVLAGPRLPKRRLCNRGGARVGGAPVQLGAAGSPRPPPTRGLNPRPLASARPPRAPLPGCRVTAGCPSTPRTTPSRSGPRCATSYTSGQRARASQTWVALRGRAGGGVSRFGGLGFWPGARRRALCQGQSVRVPAALALHSPPNRSLPTPAPPPTPNRRSTPHPSPHPSNPRTPNSQP